MGGAAAAVESERNVSFGKSSFNDFFLEKLAAEEEEGEEEEEESGRAERTLEEDDDDDVEAENMLPQDTEEDRALAEENKEEDEEEEGIPPTGPWLFSLEANTNLSSSMTFTDKFAFLEDEEEEELESLLDDSLLNDVSEAEMEEGRRMEGMERAEDKEGR